MRILVNGYFSGGNCPDFVHSLKQFGHQVYVVDTGLVSKNKGPLSEYLSDHDTIFPDYNLFEILTTWALRKVRSNYWTFLAIPKYKRIIKNLNPDLIINHKINIRANIMLRTGFPGQISYVYGSEVADDNLRRKEVHEVMQRSRYILTNTVEMRRYLLSEYPDCNDKVLHLPWGFSDLETLTKISKISRSALREKYGLKPDELVFFDSRSLRGINTGIKTIVESFQRFLKNNPESRLVFISGYLGNPSVKRYVDDFVTANKDVRDKIIIKGGIESRIEYLEWLHLSDVFLSLLSNDQFGFSIYEAVFFQKKLILFDLPVYRNLLKDLPSYINKYDTNELVEQMEKSRVRELSKYQDVIELVKNEFDHDKCYNNINTFLQTITVKTQQENVSSAG